MIDITAFRYGTNMGSQQTAMLAAQDGISSVGAFPWAQALGVITSAMGARTSAKIEKNNLLYQGRLSMLNAGFQSQMAKLNAGYSSASTQSAAAHAEAMAAINAQGIRDASEVNAKISQLAAESALESGNKDIAILTLKAGQVKGAQRAALAANGVDIGEGSAAEVAASTEILKEIDVQQIKSNAIASAWGYKTQAASQTASGLVDAANANIRGITQAADIRREGAQEVLQIQTQGAWDSFSSGNTARANYAASNAISPSRSMFGTLIVGGTQVAESWYRLNKAKA